MVTTLIDLNIILDVLLKRLPFYENSLAVWNLCLSKKRKGALAAHTIPTLWYILRKEYTDAQRRELLSALFDYFEISSLNKEKIESALNRSDFKDFEDCLQDECAIDVEADCIVTRNKQDFETARTKVYTPEEFIERFN